MLLQLNPVMLPIAHHSVVCVCLSICAYSTRCIHTVKIQLIEYITTYYATEKIEIAPGLYDANLLHGNTVLPETCDVIKHQTS